MAKTNEDGTFYPGTMDMFTDSPIERHALVINLLAITLKALFQLSNGASFVS